MPDVIAVRGARTHNLKNIDIDIPRNRLVVITGVSGSGKSSLAFDTLLAEGQRQYVQSLSVYARQFFDELQRPDVDRIDGLQPTIAIDQRQGAPNPRSTVGTITEVYDYLRLLMARAGDVVCPNCGTPIVQQTPAEIEQSIRSLPDETRVMILAPLVRGRRGSHRDVIEAIQKAGFVRARIDGSSYPLEDAPPLVPQKMHDIEAVVDRVVIRQGIEARLAESVRLATRHGDGVVMIVYQTPEAKAANQDSTKKPNGKTNGTPAISGEGWEERLLNTRYACPRCQTSVGEIEPRTFSFNSPYGACPICHGLGTLGDEEITPLGQTNGTERAAEAESRKQTARLSTEKQTGCLPPHAGGSAEPRPTSNGSSGTAAGNENAIVCPACHGSRLRPEARACRLNGLVIHEITGLPVTAALAFFRELTFGVDQRPVAEPIVAEIVRRLAFLERVGADYLSLDRPADTLSGGERQRVRLATGIGSGLVGILYLLDEPSIGLHPRDNDRLIAAFRDLERQGNTVVVVEHDEALMRSSDYLIDMGPGAGSRGGQVVAHGTPNVVAHDETSLTGAYLSGRLTIPIPTERRKPAKTRRLHLMGATANNLQDVDVEIPLGLLVCVAGVSGSGKSSLVVDTLARTLARKLNGAEVRAAAHRGLRGASQLDRLVEVNQSPIGRTPRSNAATYTGIWNDIRAVFAATKLARLRGYGTGRFSFNTPGGRCEECQGQGVRRIEMNFLPDLEVTCPVCHGARFNRQTLAVKYREKSVADVLAMSVDEAVAFFENHDAIRRLLGTLVDVGLGYLMLGQASTTLSGGEAQRIKLATELGRQSTGHTMYILDEPTTGLHSDDIRRLLVVLNRLVDQGNSVLVIEHNLDVIKTADWVIDLGPEGGAGGGRIVAVGRPEEITACEMSHTGQYLKSVLGESNA
ncbi:MAG: excinuclease ABC subunit UvrA [Planctomycetes bacterium]|nr:excinuclease ABC subunit UvrA [Planctomycetota bacterium]